MPANSPRGMSHPTVAELVRAVERTVARLPLKQKDPRRSCQGEGDGGGSSSPADTENDGGGGVRVRRHSAESTGTCSSAASAGHCSAGSAMDVESASSASSASSSSTTSRCGKHGRSEEEDGGGGVGLESMDAEALRRKVEPIARALEGVDAAGMLGLEPVLGASGGGGNNNSGGSDVEFRPIHASILPRRPRDGGTCVRYLHIAELEERYSMGVFVFPPHSTIPLHDHPGMCVLSRVLYGALQVRSFDVLSRDVNDEEEEEEEEDGGESADDDGDTVPEEEDDPTPSSDEDRRAATAGSVAQEAATVRRKSSFSWVAEAFSSVKSSSAIGDPPPGAAANSESGAAASHHRTKPPSRTGSWLSSILFPGRRESSSISVLSEQASPPSSAEPKPKEMGRRRKKKKKSHPEGTLHAQRNPMRSVSAPGVLTLYPSEGNAHEFTAGPGGAAVLDVLLPPYDFEHDRDCTFYRAEDDVGEGFREGDAMEEEGRANAPPGNIRRRKRRRTCYLVPIPQPRNFHCISGTYLDFGTSDQG